MIFKALWKHRSQPPLEGGVGGMSETGHLPKNAKGCFPISLDPCRWCMCNLVIFRALWRHLSHPLPEGGGGGKSDRGESFQKSGFLLDTPLYICRSLGKHTRSPEVALERPLGPTPPLAKMWEYLENRSTDFHHRGWDMIPEMSSTIYTGP
jgi:hypothetical protein